jgi:DNA repair protein RadC
MRSFFELDKQLGMYRVTGPVSASQILSMAHQLVQSRHADKTVLNSPAACKAFIQPRMRFLERETFSCLLLDSKHQLLSYVELFSGSIANVSVHPREVVKLALAENASAAVLAHNHPSGDATPSKHDITLTQHVSAALGFVDVKVIDHIVVGEPDCASFAELGLM